MLNIKERLDEYLEFDSNLLFYPTNAHKNLSRIFGGAIRDIIANQEIHDVDILCGSQSIKFVENVLARNGYTFMPSLESKDLAHVYMDIKVINEPATWMKGTKIVQVIRPSGMGPKDLSKSEYEEGFLNLIANVDISCCGVSWDGKLHENFKNAILHCHNKVFYVNEKAKMYSQKRISTRIWKFVDRGWTQIESNDIVTTREEKIKNILSLTN
jgi:hypothetical protein